MPPPPDINQTHLPMPLRVEIVVEYDRFRHDSRVSISGGDPHATDTRHDPPAAWRVGVIRYYIRRAGDGWFLAFDHARRDTYWHPDRGTAFEFNCQADVMAVASQHRSIWIEARMGGSTYPLCRCDPNVCMLRPGFLTCELREGKVVAQS